MKKLPLYRKYLLLVALALASLFLACSDLADEPISQTAPEPIVVLEGDALGPAPSFPSIPTPPDSDLYALAESFRAGGAGSIPRLATIEPSEEGLGHQKLFWVIDLDARRPFQVTATLRHISPHLRMYVADGASVRNEDLARSAEEFEEIIYPEIVSQFGEVFGTGPGARLTVLHANIPAVSGYYSPSDEYPTVVRPFSNQQRMIYMNLGAVRPGTDAYSSVLAHELQHAAHHNSDPTEEVWINEGLSTLAEEVVGSLAAWQDYFRQTPDTQLTGWQLYPTPSHSHYGAANLFLKYLQQHYGGADPQSSMKALVSEPADGIEGVNSYLSSLGYDADFDQVFKDWVVANYLDDPGGGKYGYEGQDFNLLPTERIKGYERVEGSVHQYAADYVQVTLNNEGGRIIFQGSPHTRLIPNEAHSGRWQWWSNRGDSIDSTLTREFDLSGVQRATLNYWAWYDIEEGFDYAYVEASADGGVTWDILQGSHSTGEDPLGNSFGYAYTGTSLGESITGWVHESIDISDYAGKVMLLRFQYVTDEAVNTSGLALDDISIPEIGFFDDVEVEGGWEARGFYRTDNRLPQRYFVQAILPGDDARVLDVPLDGQQMGGIIVPRFEKGSRVVVLVIAGATPVTSEVATYQVTVEPLLGE